jgi:hypothetical protein
MLEAEVCGNEQQRIGRPQTQAICTQGGDKDVTGVRYGGDSSTTSYLEGDC